MQQKTLFKNSSWQALERQLEAGCSSSCVGWGNSVWTIGSDWWVGSSKTAASYLFPGPAHPPLAEQDETGAMAWGSLFSLPTAKRQAK
jgi:hypothetical protein